jgi:hypothetical protein
MMLEMYGTPTSIDVAAASACAAPGYGRSIWPGLPETALPIALVYAPEATPRPTAGISGAWASGTRRTSSEPPLRTLGAPGIAG